MPKISSTDQIGLVKSMFAENTFSVIDSICELIHNSDDSSCTKIEIKLEEDNKIIKEYLNNLTRIAYNFDKSLEARIAKIEISFYNKFK